MRDLYHTIGDRIVDLIGPAMMLAVIAYCVVAPVLTC